MIWVFLVWECSIPQREFYNQGSEIKIGSSVIILNCCIFPLQIYFKKLHRSECNRGSGKWRFHCGKDRVKFVYVLSDVTGSILLKIK